jgi:hypothetical protein
MPDAGMLGGGKLDMYLRKIAEHAGPPQETQVGFLAGSTEANGVSLPMVAFLMEFGAPKAGIPPRPYFRTMVAKHKGEWGDQLGKLLVAHDYDGTRALNLMGEVISGELRESIIDLTAPALSAVTLMLRKMRGANPDLVVTGKVVGEAAARVKAGESTSGVSTKPLVDSGTMLNGVGHQVTES